MGLFDLTPPNSGRASDAPSPHLRVPAPWDRRPLAWSRPLPPNTPVKGYAAFPVQNAFHRQQPREAFPASRDSRRVHRARCLSPPTGLCFTRPLARWFQLARSPCTSIPQPQHRLPTSAVFSHDPRTRSADSGPRTPLRGPSDARPKTHAGRPTPSWEPPHRKRSSLALPGHRPDALCHPVDSMKSGEIPCSADRAEDSAENALHEEVHPCTKPGTFHRQRPRGRFHHSRPASTWALLRPPFPPGPGSGCCQPELRDDAIFTSLPRPP